MKTSSKAILGVGTAATGCLMLCTLGIGGLMLMPIEDPLFGDISDFDPEQQPWTALSVPVPGSLTITFERRIAHPFFAEYNRRLTVGDAASLDLPMNPGGQTDIDVYWADGVGSDGPWLRLSEHWGEHVVDLAHPQSIQHICENDGQRWLVSSHGCGFSGPVGGPQSPTGDAVLLPFEGRERHLGTIDGRHAPLHFVADTGAPGE